MLDTLVAALPPFEVDADFNIARGIIEKIGVGKIVRRDPSRAPRLRALKNWDCAPGSGLGKIVGMFGVFPRHSRRRQL